jgi:dTDP-4-amino-4,6-dideoxygalactose transaminase
MKPHDPWQVVRDFEVAVADYAGASYGVAVDTGFAALFLCCKFRRVEHVILPARTHISVPSAIIHAGGTVEFEDREWKGQYALTPYRIIDSACRFQKGMHHPETDRCVSFHSRKHLAIGRGGMILTNDPGLAAYARQARYFGRRETMLECDEPAMVGWNLYMEPDRAARGLLLLSQIPEYNRDLEFCYRDLREIPAFKGLAHAVQDGGWSYAE